MKKLSVRAGLTGCLLGFLIFLGVLIPRIANAAGVTVITHGLNGNVDGWVTGMANEIPKYPRFPGTNYSFYEIFFISNGDGYNLAWSRLGGSRPTATDSGEIIVAFDWSQLADGNSYNTYQIATILEAVLLNTNFISELNGHALCELPIHLIGHSRGGSLMCQTILLLGTNGVWVDQVTTLDPHPLNDPNFPLDFLLYSAVDAPCATYQNVLFHDNYWENIGLFVHGEPVSGAYVRKLTNLSGGYENTGDAYYPHSNVHLWYHGSIDFDNPASDTEALITTTERSNWWVPSEDQGIVSGFYYSLIGGGNRMSADMPLGQGFPAIVDGYNRYWDLGAGSLNPNRTDLPSNNGTWPNLIKFNVTGTNVVRQNELIGTKLYYQYGGSSNLTMQIYFDRDFNPYDSNSIPIVSLHPPATGTSSVSYYSNFGLAATNVASGTYSIYAKLSDGIHTRYLYASEMVTITSMQPPPTLDIHESSGGQFIVGVNGVSGQKIALETSSDLQSWTPLGTNILTTSRWNYTNNLPANQQFYRAVIISP
jgi:hypothetical protein